MTTDLTHHWDRAFGRGMPDTALLLIIDVTAQTLCMIEDGTCVRHYDISTSDKGLGNRMHSYQTPSGWHRVVEGYGVQAEPGTVFRNREPTGEVLAPSEWSGTRSDDLILTRILRLAGLEPGINQGGDVDTFDRYIYLHGTNHEEAIGRPASAGCIRLRNADIMDLFNRLADREVWCWLGEQT